MNRNLSTFRTRLEEYIFAVSAHYIDQVDDSTQNLLIKLYLKIGSDEEGLLHYPIATKRCYQDENIKTIDRLIAVYQAGIDHTQHTINSVEKLLLKAEFIGSQDRKERLIAFYTTIRGENKLYLERLLRAQQVEINKLDYHRS